MASFRNRLTLALLIALASTSVLAGRPVQIVSEGKADNGWSPSTAVVEPGYPPGMPVETGDACVSIGYYLGEDGVPSQFALLKGWSDPARAAGVSKQHRDLFAQTAVAILQQRRFVAAPGTRTRPIYTSATFAFAADPRSDKEGVRSHCAIRDLKAFIANAQRRADPGSWEQIRWNGEWFRAKNTRIHGLNRE